MIQRFMQFFLLLVLSGCAYPTPQKPDDILQSIPSLEYASISYGNEMEREEKLFMLDSRAYFDIHGVISLCMRFRTQRLVDLCEGRDLIVRLTEGLLERLNTDEGVSGILKNFPITSDRLCINIEFESFYGRYIDPLYMGRIRLERGIVYYYTHLSTDPNALLWKQRIEPYQKALRFSRFRKEDLMQHKSCYKDKNPYHHEKSNDDEPYDHVVSHTEFNTCQPPEEALMEEGFGSPVKKETEYCIPGCHPDEEAVSDTVYPGSGPDDALPYYPSHTDPCCNQDTDACYDQSADACRDTTCPWPEPDLDPYSDQELGPDSCGSCSCDTPGISPPLIVDCL